MCYCVEETVAQNLHWEYICNAQVVLKRETGMLEKLLYSITILSEKCLEEVFQVQHVLKLSFKLKRPQTSDDSDL